MSLVEGIIVILSVLACGIGYTILFMHFYNDVKKEMLAKQEQCQSAEDESEE